ncbi:hypothetical protein AA0115_g1220 [Alternaria tenuissima]|uniref:Uncharacterized protein n=1 Tax=Alternaria tenuissima TaxID=119927 RepID=A0AB37WVM4_9PLEO|nr:hypothetical protein AA0115_g1220 [Alternaria tenuissima]
MNAFNSAASSLGWRKLADVGAVDTPRHPPPRGTKKSMIGYVA